MGALEDFSRRPPQYKVGVFVGIGALLGLLYWQFGYQPLRKARDAAEADRDGQKAEASRLRQQKSEYDDLIDRETELKSTYEQNQKALPSESEMPAFFDMLARRTAEAGVEAIKREVRKDIPIENFIKVPVDIEVTGTYYQLKRFFASLRQRKTATTPGEAAEKDRIVTIENLTISDPKVKNNEIVLTARFTAATFRAAPAPEPATPPGAQPGARPAAGGAPAGAAPGARPATSGTVPPGSSSVVKKPREMKARVEAAGEAADTRAQRAAESGGEKLPRDPLDHGPAQETKTVVK